VGIYDGAHAQYTALRAAGLGGQFASMGGLGSMGGMGQANSFQNISAAEDRMRAQSRPNFYIGKPAVKTFRDELQEETNEWLKDIKGE
jgi:hypothetical protein